MKKFIENFSILSFAKVMAFIIIALTTSNLMFAVAADVVNTGFNWDSLKTQVLQWAIGVFLSCLTIIVGYVANLLRYGITHLYDVIRTYIANTQILEVLSDLKDFCLNETNTVETMAQKALVNDNKIDDKEMNEIVQKVVSDAIAMWGEKKVAYLTKYRPMLREWLTLKAKGFIQGMIDSFRARQSQTDTATAK